MQAIATRGRLAAAASPTIRFFASRPAAARGSLPSWRAASRLPDVASPPLPTGEPSCHAGPAHGSSCDVPPSRVPQLMRAVRGLGCTLRKMAPGLMALAVVAATSLALPSSATAAAVGAHEPSNPLSAFLSFMLHLDKHMSSIITTHGNATYGIIWAIVFCETGLVLTPFLPGDSLLFAAGAFAGMGKLNVMYLCVVFISSAILGDAVNYAIGNKIGQLAIDRQIIKQSYVKQTEDFYAKYGGKTVVLARFVPIVRTFAPFIAGVGRMSYPKFAAYNVGGALLWTALFVGAGFFFGNLPVVQKNFTLVVLAIVAVSVVPVIVEVINARRHASSTSSSS